MERDEAIRATRNGAIVACMSGALTLAVGLIAILSSATGTFGFWNDPMIFFDVLLIFGCAFGIYKKSRLAAIVLFCYVIFSKIYIYLETGQSSGLFIAAIFLFYFGRAIQGAFVFHKKERSQNPNYKPTPKWTYFVGLPLLCGFIGLLGLGLMSMTGVIPSTEVQTGNQMAQSEKDLLISRDILTKDDHIAFFYSTGFDSILEGGSILTRDRVIRYWPTDSQQIEVYEIYLEDIQSVELMEKGNTLNDSVYKVISHQPDMWLQLPLSTENGGDIKWVEALRSQISGKK